MKKRIALLLAALTLVCLFGVWGCTGSNNTDTGEGVFRFIGGASYNVEDGSFIFGDVLRDGFSYSGGSVSVNGQALSYGLPIEYEGQVIATLPMYYSDMPFLPGDTLTVTAGDGKSKGSFFTSSVVVPGTVTLTQPQQGAFFSDNSDIEAKWSQAADAYKYQLSYFGPDGDELAYFGLWTTELGVDIPAGNTLPGEGEVSVSAMNGENLDDLFDESKASEDENPYAEEPYHLDKSYWFAGSYDENEITVDDDNLIVNTGKGSQQLRLLKKERVKINGIKLTRYTYDAKQITAPGTVYVRVKLYKYHLAVSAVNAFDAQGKEIFKWKKVRAYKSKSKSYSHTIRVSPYSTVVIHTKRTKIKRKEYVY